MKNLVFLLIMVALLCQCGGSSDPFTPIKKPVAIALSNVTSVFEGRTTKFVFVADEYTQGLMVLDTVQEKIIDNYDGDDFDYSPIPVGGQPSAVAVDEDSAPYRIYVADRFNKQLIAYEISNSIGVNDNFVNFKPVSLGGANKGISTRYLFKESGAPSSPTMTSINVDPANAKNEAWRLSYQGNGEYEVLGTISGLQTKKAIEGKKYTSDGEEIEFFISPGGERTTSGDQFFFTTAVVKPLQLNDAPVDMLVSGRKLYVLTQNQPTIVVFDLDNLTIEGTFPLPDSSAMPTHMFRRANKIYISNLNSGDVFSFSTTPQTFSTISTTLSSVRYVSADAAHLYFAHNAEAKLSIANLTGVIEKTLNINDTGNFFFTANVSGKQMGFIPNMSGNVDVIDMDESKRVDTDLRDKSDFVSPQFYDVPPISSPQLISVDATPNKTLNETWQMIFDESDETYTVTGSKSGLQINKATPGETYTSDLGEISLLIRPSFGAPETDGDFFSFQTLDPIDPILILNQSMAVGGIGFSKISDGKLVGYIIQQTNGQVSIVNLADFSLEKTL